MKVEERGGNEKRPGVTLTGLGEPILTVDIMNRRSLLKPLVALVGLVSHAQADAPEIRGLFPAGARAGHDTILKIIGKPGTAPSAIRTDRPDVVVTPTDKPEEFLLKSPAECRPGVVWLRWHNADGASEPRPVVIGMLPELAETEPNNAANEAQPVADLPVVMNGGLTKRGDIDTFAVTLTAGQTLVAAVEAHRTLPSPIDAVLQVTDARGFVIEQNEDRHDIDPLIAWTVPRTGTYLVRVFAFPSQTDSSINYYGADTAVYRLTLTTGPVIDRIIPLVRQPGPITVRGWNLPTTELALIADEASLRIDPAAGTLPIPGFDLDQLPRPVGTVLREDPAAESQTVPLPATVSGTIETAGDRDRYRFAATKGQSIQFQATARSLGSLADIVLRLLKADGSELKQVDDTEKAADPHGTHTIPADGEYLIEVVDRFRSGSDQHFYALTMQVSAPEFTLSIPSNRYIADASKPLDIPVTVTRQGLSVPIIIAVEGLPTGVMCEATPSASEGDTSKTVTLKLVIAPEAVAFSGPLRIVGRATGPESEQTATAPIDSVEARTAEVWLTVKK